MAKYYPQKPRMSEVVSVVAHQLKNPLTVIKSYLEVLISEDLGKVNQNQKEYLGDALKNIKRMAKIVDYLLDVSRIEEGKYQIALKKFSLEKITQEIIKDFSLWIRAFNSEVSLKFPRDLLQVISDPLKIRQVIENLIFNALKFKSPGRGKIEITFKRKGKFILFSCKDNGIGIPREDFKKIFSKFYRSEKAMELDPSGTGLGLYINKAIITLSGGKIWFKKNKGPGMTFFFTLPVAKTLVFDTEQKAA